MQFRIRKFTIEPLAHTIASNSNSNSNSNHSNDLPLPPMLSSLSHSLDAEHEEGGGALESQGAESCSRSDDVITLPVVDNRRRRHTHEPADQSDPHPHLVHLHALLPHHMISALEHPVSNDEHSHSMLAHALGRQDSLDEHVVAAAVAAAVQLQQQPHGQALLEDDPPTPPHADSQPGADIDP